MLDEAGLLAAITLSTEAGTLGGWRVQAPSSAQALVPTLPPFPGTGSCVSRVFGVLTPGVNLDLRLLSVSSACLTPRFCVLPCADQARDERAEPMFCVDIEFSL